MSWNYCQISQRPRSSFYSGAHFTNDFIIQIRWKFHSALIQVLVKWLLWNFARDITAVLSWHVQNFVVVLHNTMKLHQNQFSIEFEWWCKNHLWNGPQNCFYYYRTKHTSECMVAKFFTGLAGLLNTNLYKFESIFTSLEPDKSASFCILLCWWSSLFAATIRDVWLILSFFNLGLFAACWVHFMCHHKLWPTSGSHPFSFLNNSLGHSYIITQPINGTRWFRERPLNLITHSIILWLFSLTVSTYKEKFTAICQQIFELGLAKHEERVAEKKMFWECVNDAKRENKEAGVTKIEEFMDYKKKVGVRINFLIVCSSAFSSSQKKKT